MAPKRTTSAASAAPAEEVVATPEVIETAPSATTEQVPEQGSDLAARIGELAGALAKLVADAKDVAAKLKAAQKDVAKLQKAKDAAVAKRGKRGAAAKAAEGGAPRRPSGFAKPAQLSAQLCEFLGVAADTKLARTDVTRQITKYIKDNQLYGQDDKRTIQPDAKLQALLSVPADKKLTYFNLQAFIKHHFVKEEAAPAATTSA